VRTGSYSPIADCRSCSGSGVNRLHNRSTDKGLQVFCLTRKRSETAFCLHLEVKAYLVGPINRTMDNVQKSQYSDPCFSRALTSRFELFAEAPPMDARVFC
jgi:hypothetical protein